jgi:hypothetical protein
VRGHCESGERESRGGARAGAGRAAGGAGSVRRGERTRTSDPAVPGRVRCRFATPRRRGSPGARTLTSRVKSRVYYHRARDPSCPGIELNDHLSVFSGALAPRKLPGLVRSRMRAAIASSSSTIHLSSAPSSPRRCRPAVSAVLGDRRFARDAVSRGSGGRNRTLIARSRISRPTVRRPLIVFVSPEI